MTYKSPIEIMTSEIATELIQKEEEMVVRAVQEVVPMTNREELIKALAYDRKQYEKGYADGWADKNAEIVRCKDCKHRPYKDEDGDVWPPSWGDETCPCICEDCYYNWMPEDDFFCKRGERRE